MGLMLSNALGISYKELKDNVGRFKKVMAESEINDFSANSFLQNGLGIKDKWEKSSKDRTA